MPTPRNRQAVRLRARRQRAQRRARRLVVLAALGLLALVTVLVTAFGSGASDPVVPVVTATRPAAGLLTRPEPEALATVGNLRLLVPVAADAVTGIGYHGSADGALTLNPAGHQANQGVLAALWRRIVGARRDGPIWYQLDGAPGTAVVDVGVAPGTDVYAPAKGTVVAISDIVIGGRAVGSRIDIRPQQAPSVTVSVSHVEPDRALAVGAVVVAPSSRLGSAVDIAAVERQALAAHARDDGNNVSVSVYPTASSLP